MNMVGLMCSSEELNVQMVEELCKVRVPAALLKNMSMDLFMVDILRYQLMITTQLKFALFPVQHWVSPKKFLLGNQHNF